MTVEAFKAFQNIARLYQLEIIKLRMQVQEMTKIDRDARAHAKIEKQVMRDE